LGVVIEEYADGDEVDPGFLGMAPEFARHSCFVDDAFGVVASAEMIRRGLSARDAVIELALQRDTDALRLLPVLARFPDFLTPGWTERGDKELYELFLPVWMQQRRWTWVADVSDGYSELSSVPEKWSSETTAESGLSPHVLDRAEGVLTFREAVGWQAEANRHGFSPEVWVELAAARREAWALRVLSLTS
jgi:hypothetical protein